MLTGVHIVVAPQIAVCGPNLTAVHYSAPMYVVGSDNAVSFTGKGILNSADTCMTHRVVLAVPPLLFVHHILLGMQA